MRRLLLVGGLVAAIAAAPAAASDERPTLAELEGRIMCPTCEGQTLAESNAPSADRVRRFIELRIRAGDTRSEIEDKLEAQYGPRILASPPASGFGLLAWVLPLAGVGVGALVVGVLAWRWSRTRERGPALAGPELDGQARLDAELERRVDEELARMD